MPLSNHFRSEFEAKRTQNHEKPVPLLKFHKKQCAIIVTKLTTTYRLVIGCKSFRLHSILDHLALYLDLTSSEYVHSAANEASSEWRISLKKTKLSKLASMPSFTFVCLSRHARKKAMRRLKSLNRFFGASTKCLSPKRFRFNLAAADRLYQN